MRLTPLTTPVSCPKLRKPGGKWNASKKTWNIDERTIDTVRAIMREVYGQDDTPQETVTVKVTEWRYKNKKECLKWKRKYL